MKKLKAFLSLAVVLEIIINMLPTVFSVRYDDSYINCDTESFYEDTYYFLDENNYIFSGLPGSAARNYFTDYPVDKFAAFNNKLYACKGNSILCVNTNNKESKTLITSADAVLSFSVQRNSLFYLSNGNVLKTDLEGNEEKEVIVGKYISQMWLEDIDILSYMTDGEYIYSLDLNTGNTTAEINFASSFIGDIPVIDHNNNGSGSSTDAISFSSLQAKFPSGAYWNHMGSSSNNPNGYTYTPCNHSSYGTSYCNHPTFYSAWQCHGYAVQCGYDIVGTNPMNWTKYTSSSYVDSIKAGDIVRLDYSSNQHTILVLSVNGNEVAFTDCNSYGTCNIRWGAVKTKSTIKTQFSYILKCPSNLSNYYPGGSGGTVEYTLKFVLNDSTGKSKATCSEASRTIKDGEAYGILPVPVREGYIFLGWYTDASAGTKVSDKTVAGTNVTVYAHWQILTYTVKYDANAGDDTVTNMPDSQIKEHFETLKLNITGRTLRRDNYNFNYWNTKPDGSGTAYTGTNYYYADNADVTLYAQWEGQTKSIYFDANGGTVSPGHKNVKYGEVYGELPVPTRTGYRFLYWKSESGNLVNSTTIMNSSGTVKIYAQWEEMTYFVSYNSNSGTDYVSNMPSSQTKYYSKALTLKMTTPSRYGYTFSGWNSKADGTGTTYTNSSTYQTNKDLTIYAQWQPIESMVTFDSNGGSEVDEKLKVKYGQPYGNLPETQKEGKDFVGWFKTKSDNSDSPITEETTVDIIEDITLYAKWETAKYRISYNSNNTSVNNMPYDSVRLYDEDNYTISNNIPTRTGFKFLYWNTIADGSGLTYMPGAEYNENAHLTLYAIWERDKYLVEYFENSGYGAPESGYKYYELDLTLSEEVPIKTGYSMVEWNTQPDGSGVPYHPGEIYSDNLPLKLYAIWEPNKYNLILYSCGGKCAYKSIYVTYDEKYNLPDPERRGYQFDGWYDAESNGNLVQSDDIVSITEDTGLYAYWTANEYIVTFNSGDGINEVTTKKVIFEDVFGVMPEPVKDGCVFCGWFADPEFTKPVYDNTVMNYDYDITLYACYITANCTVTFDPNGGMCNVVSQTYEFGEKYSNLPEPSKYGYKFTGWYSEDGEIINNESTVQAEANQILYAGWKAEKHTVNFISEGIVYKSQEIEFGEEFGNIPEIESDGYEFCGWYDIYGEKVTEKTVYSWICDIDVYARFSSIPSKGTVKFVADGITVEETVYDGNEIIEPEVPGKNGYTGSWEPYSLTESGVLVNAIYTPQSYRITWNCSGDIIEQAYTYGEKVSVPEFNLSEGHVIKSWAPEVPTVMPSCDITLNADIAAVSYIANFVALGRSAGKINYSVDDKYIDEPAVITLEGYSGVWSKYEIVPGGMTIPAVYTPVDYTAIFIADGVKIYETTFNVETKELIVPEIPEKTGYICEWETYSIAPHDITITAVYTPAVYSVCFKIKQTGEVIDIVSYTYGNKSIEEPEIPPIAGYTCNWGPYNLGASDSVVYAEYTPITYYAAFIALGETVSIVPFTIEDSEIAAPPVPVIRGIAGEWEDFQITASNLQINAIYDFPEVSINNSVPKRNESYKTTMIFTATVKNPIAGGKFVWYINGKERSGDNLYQLTVKKATKSYTVQVKYFVNNQVVAESDIETVVIQDNFFARLIASFRQIFNKLPVVIQ